MTSCSFPFRSVPTSCLVRRDGSRFRVTISCFVSHNRKFSFAHSVEVSLFLVRGVGWVMHYVTSCDVCILVCKTHLFQLKVNGTFCSKGRLLLVSVRHQEEGGEGSRGSGRHGAGLRGQPHSPQEGRAHRLRRRGGGGEHRGHGHEVHPDPAHGYVQQKVKKIKKYVFLELK